MCNYNNTYISVFCKNFQKYWTHQKYLDINTDFVNLNNLKSAIASLTATSGGPLISVKLKCFPIITR